MPYDSDVVLLGTGVAPLIAASRLMAEGRSVLALNPEWDFFSEESELPLDPFWPVDATSLSVARLKRSSPQRVLEELRPDFPGAIELWPALQGGGYHDFSAPHVRARTRVWMNRGTDWDRLEALYVEGGDAGLAPTLAERATALKWFPGVSPKAQPEDDLRCLVLPRICDYDVSRYRNGLLEFVRERLGREKVICAASQIALTPDGIRFHSDGQARTALIREGLLVFWTPKMTRWVLTQAKKAEVIPACKPKGIRLWEQWSLLSREKLDPNVVAAFENLLAWAEVDGAPSADQAVVDRLSVLRAGPLLDTHRMESAASADSFGSLSSLCHDFLKWDKFSVRSLKTRAVFEWDRGPRFLPTRSLAKGAYRAEVVCGCDGPLADVAGAARKACSILDVATGGRA